MITNGQLANQTTFNAAFVSRTQDTSTVGKLDLNNADAASGTAIANSQRELNSLGSFLGKLVNVAKDVLPGWAASEIGSAVDTLFTRVDTLSLAFQRATGHDHSGAGSGGIIVMSSLGDLKSGTESILTATQSFTVTLAANQGSSTYIILGSVVNTTDADPQLLSFVIKTQTATTFDVLLTAPTDSANYKFKWAVFG